MYFINIMMAEMSLNSKLSCNEKLYNDNSIT